MLASEDTGLWGARLHGQDDVLGFDLIEAATDPPSGASVRVLEKLGMRLTKRETVYGKDTLFCIITRATSLGENGGGKDQIEVR